LTLEQIILKLNTQATESNQSLKVFYSDEFPKSIYKKKHPHLSDGELEYISENYFNPVKKPLGDAIFETQKIFNDDNFEIKANETISLSFSSGNINNDQPLYHHCIVI